MKEFNFTIKDKDGIHARPAGMLVKLSNSFKCNIEIIKDDKKVSAKKIFSIMSICAKKNDTIILRFDGEDEDKAYTQIKKYLTDNL